MCVGDGGRLVPGGRLVGGSMEFWLRFGQLFFAEIFPKSRILDSRRAIDEIR